MADTPGTGGMDRRSLLKKSAAAGALVWAAPAVTSMSSAYATPELGDGRFTNCVPSAAYFLVNTGSNCRDYNDFVASRPDLGLVAIDPNCCDASAYGIAIAQPSCGDTCGAELFVPDGQTLPVEFVTIVESDVDAELIQKFPDCTVLFDPNVCSESTSILRISVGIRCEDGTEWVIVDDVTFTNPGPSCVTPLNGTNVTRFSTTCVSGPGCV